MLTLPGLWLWSRALHCHLWRGGLLADGGALGSSRGGGVGRGRSLSLALLRLLRFVRLGGTLDEVEESTFALLLLSILRLRALQRTPARPPQVTGG